MKVSANVWLDNPFPHLNKAITYYKEIENHLTNSSNYVVKQNEEFASSPKKLQARNFNMNRSRSSFEVSNGKIKYQNEDEVEQNKQSFIIQPGKELFMQRRGSGVNLNNYQTVNHNFTDLNNSSPTMKQINMNSNYRRTFNDAENTDFRSPRITDPLQKLRPRRMMHCMQSTQDVPRMHLFIDIISKIMRNNTLKH